MATIFLSFSFIRLILIQFKFEHSQSSQFNSYQNNLSSCLSVNGDQNMIKIENAITLDAQAKSHISGNSFQKTKTLSVYLEEVIISQIIKNNGMSIFYQLLEIGKKYSRFWQHYKSYIKSFPILRYSKKPMEQKIEEHKTTE